MSSLFFPCNRHYGPGELGYGEAVDAKQAAPRKAVEPTDDVAAITGVEAII